MRPPFKFPILLAIWHHGCMKGFFAYPVLLILLFGTSACADLQKANDAIESGDYTTALKELKPLAEQGQADAQYNLGVMYYNGWGVIQNYKAPVCAVSRS